MPTITQLEYLLAVDKERHFGKAARECNVSQPSLSTQIQKLEEELETVIFDRSKKPIIATETGKEIIEQAKAVLKEHRKLGDIASLGQREPKGEFHLAVIPTLAPYLIPLFIGEFSQENPKVKLKVNEHKTDDIIKLLVNDEIDAALLVTPLGDDRLIERHLYFEPFYAYVSQGHRLAKKKSISEADLDEEDLWLLEEGHCFRDQALSFCKMSSAAPRDLMEGSSLSTLVQMVGAGIGVTLIPRMAVMIETRNAEVSVAQLRSPRPTRTIGLVWRKTNPLSGQFETLAAMVRDARPA